MNRNGNKKKACMRFSKDGILDGKEHWAQLRIGLGWQRVAGLYSFFKKNLFYCCSGTVVSIGFLEGTNSEADACHSSKVV